jgi:uncharacterized protein YicC (UPF0701 family)
MSVQETSEETAQHTAPSNDGPPSAGGPAENVEQIREILFGPEIRQYGQRFARIEERFAHESAELRAEMRRRLDALEAYARQEVTELGKRVRAETEERTESAARLSQSLADSVKSLERHLAESDERTANSLREFRQSTFEHIKGILDDLTGQIRAIEASQTRHIEEVRGCGVDRLAFASLLTEIAVRVRGELGVTGLGESNGGPKP